METLEETLNEFSSRGVRKTLILCDKEMLRMGHAHDVINGLLSKRIKYSLFSDTLVLSMDR